MRRPEEAADEIRLLRSAVIDCRIEITRLTAERDEARREICERIAAYVYWMSVEQLARERGWDCYEKDAK